MTYLGDKLRSEAIRLWLTLDTAPTGTPTITITRGQGTALDTPISAANMTQGASTLEWYYDYDTEAAAQVGLYTAKYTAVVDGVTRFAYDNYDVTVSDADAIKTETASIQTDTTSIETKVDTVDGVVDAILVDTTAIEIDTTNIESKVDIVDTNVDTLLVDVAAVPTVGEIDTELTTQHGAGAWGAAAGTGAYNATINVQDDAPADVANAYVTVHNSDDDDAPIDASGTTDANGDITLAIDGNVYIRVSKVGFNFTSTAKNITATATYNVTGTVLTASNPVDPDVCRLRLYPLTLGAADITDLATSIIIASRDSLMKVDGQYIKNTEASFTYDAATTPDSYYFDAVRTSTCHIKCDVLGLDHDITVPDSATSDISDLQS